MKSYIVQISYREEYEESRILGPFLSYESAVKVLREWVEEHYRPDAIADCLNEFGGSLETGEFYSEEHTLEIIEREIQA